MKSMFFTGLIAILFSLPAFAQDADKLQGVWQPSDGRSMLKIDKIGWIYSITSAPKFKV